MALREKLTIHLFIDNVTDTQVDNVLAKIETFLASEPEAKLLLFQHTKEETE